jgi:hypothetical protein
MYKKNINIYKKIHIHVQKITNTCIYKKIQIYVKILIKKLKKKIVVNDSDESSFGFYGKSSKRDPNINKFYYVKNYDKNFA